MEPQLSWLDDPQVFRVGTLPAHSDHFFYINEQEMSDKTSSLTQSLDGKWDFKFAPNPQARPQHFYQPEADRHDFTTIEVPGHIELHNDAQIQYINTLYPWEGKAYRRAAYTLGQNAEAGMFSQAPDNSMGAYVTHFDLPEQWAHQRVAIQFDGVQTAMYVWLNGHFIGYAEDSFSRSEFDLTPYVKSRDNLLAVAVFKLSTASFLEDQDMFRFSGIFRSVRLVSRPKVHLEDLTIKPTLSDDFETGQLTVKAALSGERQAGQQIELRLLDATGATIAAQQQAVKSTDATVTFDQVTLPQVRCWDHHNPYLYQLVLTITDVTGRVVEMVPASVGFRRIEIKDNVILLNGQRLILNGVNRHEWNADHGRVISIADMQADLQTFAQAHINAVRTCHYPDQIPWYYLCDQAGIYMMAENNLETHGTWQKLGAVEPSVNVPGSLPQWRAAVLDRAVNNYETFKNHPAILFWSLGNESYAGDDIAAMNAYYKTVDPSRLTHYEGVIRNRAYEQQISDVESRMYAAPGEIRQYLTEAPTKPFLDCEYMHDMGNSLGGLGDYMALLDEFPSYAGGFIWDFIDQALWVNDEVTGQPALHYGGDFDDRHSDYEFSGDGVMFADRTPKPALQEVAYYYGKYDK